VNGTALLQALTAAAVTFAVLMMGILLVRRIQGQSQGYRQGPSSVELQVSPYLRRPSILNQAEARFYYRLTQAVGDSFLVAPKIRLADVIDVRGDAMEWKGSWNRIAAKHIDFLLVSKDDFRPLLAIELDFEASFGTEGKSGDEWLERALMVSGMPIMKVKLKRDYDPAALRRQIDLYLSS